MTIWKDLIVFERQTRLFFADRIPSRADERCGVRIIAQGHHEAGRANVSQEIDQIVARSGPSLEGVIGQIVVAPGEPAFCLNGVWIEVESEIGRGDEARDQRIGHKPYLGAHHPRVTQVITRRAKLGC